MIKVRGQNFICDECPLCEGAEHRLETAAVLWIEPQVDHCGCDKVQTEFSIGGYCEDAFEQVPTQRTNGSRKTGSAYRRQMRRQKRDRQMEIMTYGYHPAAGYTDWGWVDGVYQPAGDHIQYPKNSNRQVYWKNQSNRKVRRYKGDLQKGNAYRKLFEYTWMVY